MCMWMGHHGVFGSTLREGRTYSVKDSHASHANVDRLARHIRVLDLDKMAMPITV